MIQYQQVKFYSIEDDKYSSDSYFPNKSPLQLQSNKLQVYKSDFKNGNILTAISYDELISAGFMETLLSRKYTAI